MAQSTGYQQCVCVESDLMWIDVSVILVRKTSILCRYWWYVVLVIYLSVDRVLPIADCVVSPAWVSFAIRVFEAVCAASSLEAIESGQFWSFCSLNGDFCGGGDGHP